MPECLKIRLERHQNFGRIYLQENKISDTYHFRLSYMPMTSSVYCCIAASLLSRAGHQSRCLYLSHYSDPGTLLYSVHLMQCK